MFTGIIEEIGTISHIAGVGQALRLTINCKRVLEDVHVGDSIAVNGICLTVTQFDSGSFQSDVMPETFRSTSLGELKAASRVNLERALPLGGRLGGHLVSGHIDGTGRIIRRKKENNALWLEIEASAAIMKYVVMKGSVTLEGTSLTVSALQDNHFAVSLIPHTAEMTTLAEKSTGSRVNIECDILAKYVEKLMHHEEKEPGGLTINWLQEQGY